MCNTLASMQRRTFVQAAAATGGLALIGRLQTGTSTQQASRFGPLQAPNNNGLSLPRGFTSRTIAVTGRPVGTTDYVWHPNPDGGACFAQPDGGWIYVSNDEASGGDGGVSMVRFDAQARIVEARQILSGTTRNCAGGPTPWGSWLSCEEFDAGRVWECDPTGRVPATVRPAMGTFSHEAAAADPSAQQIYLTEDQSDGGLYRFTPARWGDLSSGVLHVMTEQDGTFGWAQLPDPTATSTPTRYQVESMKRFEGGEGAWFERGRLYFTTKRDNRVWCYEPERNDLTVLYDVATAANPVLSGVDNVTMAASGELYVCEDGGNMEVVVLGPGGSVEPFLRMQISGSEVTGAAFDPSGTRLYVSSQRNPGVTFEVTGPFASVAAAPTLPSSTTERLRPRRSSSNLPYR